MATDLKGWHPGELAIQRKLAFDGPMSMVWTSIDACMPEQHRTFHTRNLPFIPVTTLDARGRPWGSILAGQDGAPGFVQSPNEQELRIRARVWEGEPLVENLERWMGEGPQRSKFLTAGIGIEFTTRRRNKFAGWVKDARKVEEGVFELSLHVNQALGNCPKYINIRNLVPHPATNPHIAHRELDLHSPLPAEIIAFIHAADTVFVGSTYVAKASDAHRFPSHAGMNQRGGRAGFLRVRPSDGRTVVLPDYSGNRFMTTLGNIEATPLAALTVVSFDTGDVLYLTGNARTLVGEKARALMPRQNVLTTVEATGFVFVRDALPVRQLPGSVVQRSPYSPPIKLLREESAHASFADRAPTVRLRRIETHTPDLATLEWDLVDSDGKGSGAPLAIVPGQAALLDFTNLLGQTAYSHMAPWAPTSINDDRVRTWTVSSAHAAPMRRFATTMRRKEGGVVTGALFSIAHKLREHRPELLEDMRPLEIDIGLVGIAGDFGLPPVGEGGTMKLLWAAGGIGVTPFLSMLEALAGGGDDLRADVVLALSTREPEVLLGLIRRALTSNGHTPLPERLRLRLDVFSEKDATSAVKVLQAGGVHCVAWHRGRIPPGYWTEVGAEGRVSYICGPGGFEGAVGVDGADIKREGFAY
ncbi:hypothetical protein OF83DRAFT_1058353 [Amylostereum chailletii]|nr:hypothetical protein OF83DRAFT_1058353 [Amylostereum chailletii]